MSIHEIMECTYKLCVWYFECECCIMFNKSSFKSAFNRKLSGVYWISNRVAAGLNTIPFYLLQNIATIISFRLYNFLPIQSGNPFS